MRKKVREQGEQDHLHLGDLEINRVTQRVHALENGQEKQIELTPIEFKLLTFLGRKPNHVFSREEVLNAVWGTKRLCLFAFGRHSRFEVEKETRRACALHSVGARDRLPLRPSRRASSQLSRSGPVALVVAI